MEIPHAFASTKFRPHLKDRRLDHEHSWVWNRVTGFFIPPSLFFPRMRRRIAHRCINRKKERSDYNAESTVRVSFFVTNVPNEKGNNHTLLAAAHQFGCKLQLPCQLLEPFREKKRKKIGCGPNRWQRRIRPRKLWHILVRPSLVTSEFYGKAAARLFHSIQ